MPLERLGYKEVSSNAQKDFCYFSSLKSKTQLHKVIKRRNINSGHAKTINKVAIKKADPSSPRSAFVKHSAYFTSLRKSWLKSRYLSASKSACLLISFFR